jgi:hypothetical protein
MATASYRLLNGDLSKISMRFLSLRDICSQ